MGEEYRDGLFGRRASVGFCDVVAPELQSHSADGGGRDCVGYAGDFEIEGAEGEVSGL